MTVLTVPHSPELCCNSRLHCYYHCTDEPDQGAYRICLECRHVYMTAADLVNAWLFENGWVYASADQIMGCPYCGHDF